MLNLLFSLFFSGRLFLPGPVALEAVLSLQGLRAAVEQYFDAWNPKNEKRLVVSLREQKMYVFHQRTLLAVLTVSTGRNQYTPEGNFRIYYKKKLVRAFNGDHIRYWMEFKPKFGIHGLPFDKNGLEIGADDLGSPVSAGCIRVNTPEAGLLYRFVPRHSLLMVQNNPPSF